MTGWAHWADARAAAIRAAGHWRAPRDFDGRGPEGKLEPHCTPVVSFASNDYLGLTHHPAVLAAAHGALDRYGAGSGSARLIVGSRPIHGELEHALAQWRGEEAAALFPTGFAANLGVLGALGARGALRDEVESADGVLVCSDELNHASIIDGCRLARADVAVYPHNDLDALSARLAARGARRAIVVSDTVFSMDGDAADVDALAVLCARHSAMLVLDEAHAVLGPHPDPAALAGVEHVRVGTLSKTLGALGGFVCGPRRYVDLVVNTARPYIFTTAPTPADTAAALAALGVLRGSEGAALVARLRAHVDVLRAGNPSPIVPVVLGAAATAVDAAAALAERGLLVPAIRPPTVAPGTSRLRVTLSAAHSDAHVAALVAALDDVTPTWRDTVSGSC